MKHLDVKQIEEIIPHRHPFLLVDYIEDYEPGDMKGKTAYFGGINKCKFRRKVAPGDKLRLETKIIRRKGPVGIGSAVASVDGEVAVEAELTFMIG